MQPVRFRHCAARKLDTQSGPERHGRHGTSVGKKPSRRMNWYSEFALYCLPSLPCMNHIWRLRLHSSILSSSTVHPQRPVTQKSQRPHLVPTAPLRTPAWRGTAWPRRHPSSFKSKCGERAHAYEGRRTFEPRRHVAVLQGENALALQLADEHEKR